MKNRIWIWITGILLFFILGIVAIIAKSKVIWWIWGISIFIEIIIVVIYLILKNMTKSPLEYKIGKEINEAQAETLAHEKIGKRFHDYIGVSEGAISSIQHLGEQKTYPIYYLTGKGFYRPRRHYLYAVNMKDAENSFALKFKNSPYNIKEITQECNTLSFRPEYLEVTEITNATDPETGEKTPKIKRYKTSRESKMEQEDKEEAESNQTLESLPEKEDSQ